MLNRNIKPVAAAIGTAFVASLATASIANADDNPFAANALDDGYDLLALGDQEGKCGEGKCGESDDAQGDAGEAKCGEGDEAEADAGEAEGDAGEAKCGEADTSNDAGEHKCGEGKCGG